MAGANADLIEGFYAAFARGDADAMASCYAPEARFSDPVFTDLRGEQVGAMWRMLTSRSTDLEIEADEIEADEERGSAHWVAHYTFRTGRAVVNDIRASFRFADGLIVEHRDVFDFGAWARQALGGPALIPVLGPALLQPVVRRRAAADLAGFMAPE